MKKKWTGERLETDVFSEVSIEHLHRYALALHLAERKTVLDLACGEGYGSALLATKAATVTGVDIDATTISAASAKYRLQNLKFITASADTTQLPSSSFDLVTSFETIEHVDDPVRVLAENKRLLRPGGLLMMSTPDKKWYSDARAYANPFHKKEFYRDEFISFLQSQFVNVQVFDQQFFTGSLLTTVDGNSRPLIYSGDFKSVQSVPPRPLYLLALASDGPLPIVGASIFDGSHVMRSALHQQEAAFRNTASYRLGHALLSPLKWLRNRLKP